MISMLTTVTALVQDGAVTAALDSSSASAFGWARAVITLIVLVALTVMLVAQLRDLYLESRTTGLDVNVSKLQTRLVAADTEPPSTMFVAPGAFYAAPLPLFGEHVTVTKTRQPLLWMSVSVRNRAPRAIGPVIVELVDGDAPDAQRWSAQMLTEGARGSRLKAGEG